MEALEFSEMKMDLNRGLQFRIDRDRWKAKVGRFGLTETDGNGVPWITGKGNRCKQNFYFDL